MFRQGVTLRSGAAICAALLAILFGGSVCEAQGLTSQTRAQLFGPDLQPGVYRIRPNNGPDCVGMVRPIMGQSFLGLRPCNIQSGFPSGGLEVLPLAIASFGNSLTLRVPNPGACATAARGVVLGPQRVDILTCAPNEAPPQTLCNSGLSDQRFLFQRIAGNNFRIEYWPLPYAGEGTKVFDVQNSGQDLNTAIIIWDWHDAANQKFNFERVADVSAPEAQCAQPMGWVSTPDGIRRAVPVEGVNLYGSDYLHVSTLSDSGKECAARCAADTRCRAFSWIRPSTADGKGICYMKDHVPEPSVAAGIFSGVVRRF